MKTIKRYFIIFLSIIIFVFNLSIFAYKPIQTKAAVAAVPAVGSFLWNLLMTAAVSIGAYEIYDSYNTQKELYDEFLKYSKTLTLPEGEFEIDEKKYTLQDIIDDYDALEGWSTTTGGGEPPNPDDEEPPKRDEDYWQKWGKQNSFKVNGAFLGTIADFLQGIYEDKDSELYHELFGSSELPFYTGKENVNNITPKVVGFAKYDITSGTDAWHGGHFKVTTFESYGNASGVFGVLDLSLGYEAISLKWFRDVNYIMPVTGNWGNVKYFDDGYKDFNSQKSSTRSVPFNSGFFANVPVFNSLEDAKEFILSGDDTKCINKVDAGTKNDIDFSQTLPNLSTTLNPLTLPQTGTQTQPDLSTQDLVDILLQIKAQIDALKQTQTQINTETHNNIVNNTINNVITKPDIKPEPENPDYPDVDTGTTGEGLIKDWKLVFPFCIPFDMIDLIRVLDSEPEAPYFKLPLNIELIDLNYVFELDFAMFDDVAKIFRLGETILFIVGLMIVTGKVIKW